MTGTPNITRRDIIAGLAALSAGALAGPAQAVNAPLTSAQEIGRWLIAHGVLPGDRAKLVAGIVQPDAVRSWKDIVRADFAAGDIVSVDGWVISETEARLCAVAALDIAPMVGA